MDRVLVLLSLLALGLGCAPKGALRSDGTFTKGEVRYRVPSPEGWDRARVDGADLAWARADLGASLLVNSECEGVDDAPLPVLTNHLLFGMTEREILEQRELEISRRAALETRVKARLDGVERQMAILVLKKDGCVYDLVLDVSPARFSQAVPAFEALRDRFDVLSRGGS